MRAFKVVDRETRYGTNASLYIAEWGVNNFVGTTIEIQDYFPKYEKGKTVHMVPGSIGIFCFSNWIDANAFIIYEEMKRAAIVEVNGKGLMFRPDFVNPGCGTWPYRVTGEFSRRTRPTDESWLFFERVEVLE